MKRTMMRSEPTGFIDRVVTWSLERPMSMPLQYLLAVLVIVLVGLFRVLFIPDSLPWLLFIPSPSPSP